MQSPMVLFLLTFLLGCGGTTRGIRRVNEQDGLRDLGRMERKPIYENDVKVTLAVHGAGALEGGLSVAPSASFPPMSLQSIPGEGLGNGFPRALLRLVPQDAITVAEAGTGAMAGESAVAGGAVVAAGGSVVLVCLTLNAAMAGTETPIDIADTFYGTHFGDIRGWFQGCYATRFLERRETPALMPGKMPESESRTATAPLANPEADRGKKSLGRIYVTYTKFNPRIDRYYSGRTSMVIDLRKPFLPQAEQAVDVRDSNHHIDEEEESRTPGFRQAVLDVFDVGAAVEYSQRYSDIAYWRIRGREQQLIDSLGGAQSDTQAPYRTENAKRGVAKDNPLGRLFHDAATKKWGQMHPYTGD